VHDRRVGGEHLPDQVRVGDDDEDEDRPALMNTRGLTELIVLNIGLDLGLISRSLFTMLVVMALVTTFMAGPALNLLDPKRELSAPPEEELQRARLAGVPEAAVPQLSIIVAPRTTPASMRCSPWPSRWRDRSPRGSSSSFGWCRRWPSQPDSAQTSARSSVRPRS
jgi:hypothetical protein